MRNLTVRTAAILLAIALCSLATGCKPVFRAQVVNGGDYPITSVRLTPYYEDYFAQREAFEKSPNRLPKDAQGQTIALRSGQTVTLPWVFPLGTYYVSSTFFINGEYEEYIKEEPIDFTGLPHETMVILTAQRLRDGDKAEITVTVP